MTEIKEYQLTEELKVQVSIIKNPLQIEPDALFQLAARINKKRSFLFVSPVLGKHLPVNPGIPLLIGRALALTYADKMDDQKELIQATLNTEFGSQNFEFNLAQLPKVELEKPVTIIGFCETATALGQAFYASFSSPAEYIHTTREILGADITPLLAFEEEHSHATSHKVYAENQDFFQNENEIILVDDEVTTGKTNLNIIRDIIKEFPHKKEFTIVSILDWRNESDQKAYQQLEKELGITIKEVSLLKGEVTELGVSSSLFEEEISNEEEQDIELCELPIFQKEIEFSKILITSEDNFGNESKLPFLSSTGRFGLTNKIDTLTSQAKILGAKLKSLREAGECLVLGTGEFMYVPLRIATFMGADVFFQATTRSPILSRNDVSGYPIFHKRQFKSIEQPVADNYVYRIPKNHYRDIFVMVERVVDEANLEGLIKQLTSDQTNVYVIDFSRNRIYQSRKTGGN